MRRLLVCSLVSLGALLATAAVPAAAALPVGYDVQRVNSPAPVVNGNFGRSLAVVGDVNGDGKQDMLVGNDKHGVRAGQVFVISGADGSLIRELQRPDTDAVGTGRPSGFGAAVGKIGFNQTAGPFTDIGSCPGGDSADADATCDAATVGPADGIPDFLVSASGIDVNPTTGAIDPSLNNDLGVVYIFDGASGALLRKIMMPQADRLMEVALGNDARYGRAILSPGGLFPCVGYAGIGPCPVVPNAVSAGDMNGGGTADIIVAATDLDETPANTHPGSPCAAAPAAPTCPGAGRVYVYYGEGIAGSPPTDVDDTPDTTIRDLYSKTDGGSRVGTTLTPVGDLGRCTTVGVTPGSLCPSPTRTADGKADFVSAGPDYDAYGFNGTGTVFLIDGASGAIMRQYDNPEPQPVSAMGLAQNGLIQPAFGDLGQSSTWDFYVPSTHQNTVAGTAVGRGHVFNGDVTARERFIPFAQLNDPTPNAAGNFGAAAAGIGQVDDTSVTNELLVGAIGPHAPGTNPNVMNDVHIFRTIDSAVLQSFPDPDAQPGAGFGEGTAPLGDLNGDGFLDFAIGGGGYDLTTSDGACAATCSNAGRVYIYRSNNTPRPTTTVTPPATATPTTTTAAVVLAGRDIEIEASASRLVIGRTAASRKTVRFRGRIDAFANEASCEGGQSVALQRRSKGSMTYRTFKTVTTKSNGTFSGSTKPARTYVYRARAARTSECQGAVSNRELVTVTVRKRR